MNSNHVTDDQIIEACVSSSSMAQAASRLTIHFNTLKRRAKILGVYNTNQSGKGISKNQNSRSTPLDEILNGQHPQYLTYHLKQRLFKEGLKENKCELCEIDSWNDMLLNCELDHIDGDRTNHLWDNLRILCPNCHSQTNTFRNKKR